MTIGTGLCGFATLQRLCPDTLMAFSLTSSCVARCSEDVGEELAVSIAGWSSVTMNAMAWHRKHRTWAFNPLWQCSGI